MGLINQRCHRCTERPRRRVRCAGRRSAVQQRCAARRKGQHARARLRHHQQQRGDRCGAQSRSIRTDDSRAAPAAVWRSAVSARMMPGGVGTDTGASVRLPAALCGIVGFRPTVGRYSGDGIVPISHTQRHGGPDDAGASRMRCCWIRPCPVSQGRCGSELTLSGLRIGVPRPSFLRQSRSRSVSRCGRSHPV